MATGMSGWRDRLQMLVNKCNSSSGSSIDRIDRDALLHQVIGYCLHTVKFWALGQLSAGVLSAADIHKLGFLVPGESGKYRGRSVVTDALAEIKIHVLSGDKIKVVIDQAAKENAAKVHHGWPEGVRHALIVLTAAEENREVYRTITTRLHTDIVMPEGCHGKQFGAKVSFLKHVNDTPTFSDGATFSMPLTTDDLFAALERQHQEDSAERARAAELHRLEIERLEAELRAKK
jgi:hypothetical protein